MFNSFGQSVLPFAIFFTKFCKLVPQPEISRSLSLPVHGVLKKPALKWQSWSLHPNDQSICLFLSNYASNLVSFCISIFYTPSPFFPVFARFTHFPVCRVEMGREDSYSTVTGLTACMGLQDESYSDSIDPANAI